MCGVVGILNFRSGAPVAEELLRAMTARLEHRGPDDEGYLVSGAVGLGHRRLSVIDLAGGRQPMANEDGSVVVIFNGEIYNYAELRRDLTRGGHVLRTASDTETIVHLYEELEEDCVHRLRGEFAFVLWDGRRRRLLAARDRLGVKPLCYAETPGGILFASEEKALLVHPEVEAAVDPLAVQDYFFAGLILPPRTMFRQIRCLPPGHLVLADEGGVAVRRYWDVPFVEPSPEGLERAAEEIGDRVRQAIRERLVADVPLGACLSGGLDSSTVVACAAGAVAGPLPTFTIGYAKNAELFRRAGDAVREGVRGNDADYATQVAAAFGTEHRELTLPVDDALETFDRAVWHRDRPLHVLAEHGHYHLYQAVKQRATVLLTGEGGDEVFGGYYYWLVRRSRQNTDFFPWVWRAPEPVPLERAATTHDVLEALLSEGFARPREVRARLGEAFDAMMRRPATHDFANKLGYLLLKLHVGELLALEDRLSMAHSVEARVPLVDAQVVEAVAGYPSAQKIGRRGEKALLRDGPGRVLPRTVRERIKSPFPVPFETEELYRVVCARLQGASLHLHRYLDRQALARFAAALPQASTSATRYAAFRLYTLERWHELCRVTA
jgi:asparagine synthase (glutamine-hydrolysing)